MNQFSATTLPRHLKLGTNLGYKFYCVFENQLSPAYLFIYLFFFLANKFPSYQLSLYKSWSLQNSYACSEGPNLLLRTKSRHCGLFLSSFLVCILSICHIPFPAICFFLAHQIEKSSVLTHVRNSYLTLVISPRSHYAFKCSFLTLVV